MSDYAAGYRSGLARAMEVVGRTKDELAAMSFAVEVVLKVLRQRITLALSHHSIGTPAEIGDMQQRGERA